MTTYRIDLYHVDSLSGPAIDRRPFNAANQDDARRHVKGAMATERRDLRGALYAVLEDGDWLVGVFEGRVL